MSFYYLFITLFYILFLGQERFFFLKKIYISWTSQVAHLCLVESRKDSFFLQIKIVIVSLFNFSCHKDHH